MHFFCLKEETKQRWREQNLLKQERRTEALKNRPRFKEHIIEGYLDHLNVAKNWVEKK